jgi:hypothetical protein
MQGIQGTLLGLVVIAVSACSGATPQEGETSAANEQELNASVCPEGVPPAIAPAADQTIKLSLQAVGVQVYVCNATATGFGWTFVAPQANLYNEDGRLVGTHFIGPTWQSNDGSSVVAARAAGATPDPSAIPWLLLNATGHSEVDGKFSDVTAVQRLDTVGGIAPTSTCDSSNLGSIAQVPYTAQYVFYRTKRHGRAAQCNGS